MKTHFSHLLALAFATGLAVAVNATPINITVNDAGSLLNTIGIADSSYYTSKVPPPRTNNPADNFAFLNVEIGYWNAKNNPDLPTAVSPVNAFDLTGNSYTSIAGYDYVVLHFGTGSASPKSKGGWWQTFFLDGQGGFEFNRPTVGGGLVGGFSSARYFNVHPETISFRHNVPEAGATVGLLGLALGGLVIASRRMKRANS